jgi:Ca2+-binding EF-hand superfamily protein
MTKFLIGSAVAALGIASGAAAAQQAPAAPPGVALGTAPAPLPRLAPAAPHVRVLMGGDKVMTRDEVANHIGKLFARLDTNHDGFIVKEEVQAVHQKMMGAMGDAGEIQHRLAERGIRIGDRGAMFDKLDSNRDGTISRQEFMAAKPQVREERVMIMRGGPDGALSAPGGPQAPGMRGMKGMRMHMGMGMGGHLFEMADGNHDGRVSLAEAQAMAFAHFDKADVNHDGRITPDEMRRTVRIERRQG